MYVSELEIRFAFASRFSSSPIAKSNYSYFYAPRKHPIYVQVEEQEPRKVEPGGFICVSKGSIHRLSGEHGSCPETASNSEKQIDYVLTGPEMRQPLERALANADAEASDAISIFTMRAPMSGNPMLEVMPAVLCFTKSEVDAVAGLRAILELIQDLEILCNPNDQLVITRLAEIMGIKMTQKLLNGHWQESILVRSNPNDSRIRKALLAIHSDPIKSWTLQSLADHASLSRARFAVTFKEYTGATPIDYLARLRINLAVSFMHNKNWPLSEVAHRSGFNSESSFSAAFKRYMHLTPGRYRAAIERKKPGSNLIDSIHPFMAAGAIDTISRNSETVSMTG